MFERNYFGLEDLIEASCKYCGVAMRDENYAQITCLCNKYFWGDLYKPEFEDELNKIKRGIENE